MTAGQAAFFARPSAALAHVLGLSQEQRLEDYDYLVETLGSSYLCMGVRGMSWAW